MNIAYLNQGNNNKSKKKLSNEQIKFSTKYLHKDVNILILLFYKN